MAKVKIEDFAKDLELDILYDGESKVIDIVSSSVNRPGLQLAGFFDYFAAERLQVLGKVEFTYLAQALDEAQRKSALERLMSEEIPAIIISRSQDSLKDLIIEVASKYKRPVFISKLVTTKLIHKCVMYADRVLAPSITRHGVFMDVYGVGILLVGESGIGKSETALELIKRGHRLVADDAVEIERTSDEQLVGKAPLSVRHFMEIRGVGIIDVRQMYGVGSVLNEKTLHMQIEMEAWDPVKVYDRLGISEELGTILGVKIPRLTIPVRPGRNLAIIIEVAARNYRLKKMGYNAALTLTEQLIKNEEDVV
ncbi:MAG: HPr(Ser) kinase/phosphatase [Clostridia bacterium]|nr:HPr(Ser) kinase/phosphatase [Clostridia bacterium]